LFLYGGENIKIVTRGAWRVTIVSMWFSGQRYVGKIYRNNRILYKPSLTINKNIVLSPRFS